jgi:hypothetical protein
MSSIFSAGFWRRYLGILLCGLLWAGLAGAAEAGLDGGGYQLGQGYELGSTGLHLGGYTNAKGEFARNQPYQFHITDLSLLLSWQANNRLRFFTEVEAGEPFTAIDGQRNGSQDIRLELERLYVDGLINDSLSLRIGKFLTPIGRWNLIHADPLVWTATRPVATEDLFSKHANGLMLNGNLQVAERRLEYSVYGDLSSSLDPHTSYEPFRNALGAHALYAWSDQLELGLSYASYELRTQPRLRHHLLGVEASWKLRRYELSGEWVYRATQNREPGLWQGFVQGVAPILGSHWYAVGRYELFQQGQALTTGQVGVAGLAYRPLPPLVLKFEYRLGTHNQVTAPDGFYTSFAVLF